MSDFVLSAVLELRDRMTGKIKSAAKGLDSVRSMASSASSSLDSASASMARTGESAGRLQRNLSRLGSGRYNIQLNARDMATPAINQVRTSLSQVNGRSASASVRIRDEATSRINRIRQELNSLAGRAYTATVNIRQNMVGQGGRIMNGLSNAASGMAMGAGMQMMGMAGVGYGMYDTINTYRNYTGQMSRVYAIAGADDDQRAALDAKAREMGAQTKFTSTEAGQALEYMAMAGWKTEQMLSGLEGVMNLAAASGENLGTVSDIMTDAMTAFGLKADESTRFADVLAKTTTNANTNVALLGESFKYAAPIAGALKYSVEDVSVALGLMANAGIKGSESGTALRSTFTRLARPPKQAAEALDALGIQAANADGTMKPFNQTLKELRKAFANMTDEEKVANAEAIAGKYAMSGFLAMMNATEADVQKLTSAVHDANGASADMAKTMSDNLAGDISVLGSAWEALQLELMKGKGGEGIRSFVKAVTEDIGVFKKALEDGFDISDVASLAGKIITQLRDKFLELDGVGSILAGGALVMGLMKIINLSKKALSAVKGLAIANAGTGGKAAPASVASTVSSMMVNANTVIVNGKNVTGGGAIPPGGVVPPGGKGQAPGGVVLPGGKGSGSVIYDSKGNVLPLSTGSAPTVSPSNAPPRGYWAGVSAGMKEIPKMAKGMMKGNVLTAALFGAVDVAFSDNKQKALAENGGMLAGTVAGTAAGTAIGGVIGSIVPVIGTAVGASVGGMLGGMAGGMMGNAAGEHAYDNATGAATVEPAVIEPSEWEKKHLESRRQYDENYGLSEVQIAEREHQRAVDADRRRGRSQSDILGDENQQAWNWATHSGPVAVDAAGNIEDSQNYAVVDTRTNEQWLADNLEATRRMDERLARERQKRDMAGITPYESGFMALSLDEETQKQREHWEMSKQSLDAFKEGLNELNDAALMSSQGVTAASTEMTESLQGNMPAAVESLDSAKDGIQGIGTEAEAAGTKISESFTDSATDTKAAWEPIPPFFNDDIYCSISENASACGSDAADGINSGIPSIRAAWSEITSWLAEQFSWASSQASAIVAKASSVFGGSGGVEGHAVGTSFFHGGWTEINEHGGEIIDLPKGSRIYPHATTMKMLQSTFGDAPAFAPQVSNIGSMMGRIAEGMTLASETGTGVNGASAPSVTITGNEFVVREDADIDRIAHELFQLISRSSGNYQWTGG